MRAVLLILFLLARGFDAEEDGYDYQYDENAEKEAAESDAGQRLVGASRAKDAKKLQFVVGFNVDNYKGNYGDFTTCTGSLITSTWILTAAHCVTQLLSAEEIHKCAEKGYYKQNSEKVTRMLMPPTEATCTRIPGGVKFKAKKKQGIAYLGILNVSDKKALKAGTKAKLDYIIWHENSYKGGGNYGKYGGYDVSLIKLKEPVAETPACLPGPTFTDSGIGPGYGTESRLQANLAGFGKYQRTDRKSKKSVCQTDGYGASKYHYCAKIGHGSEVCILDTPPPQPKVCQKFFNAHKDHSGKDIAIMGYGTETLCHQKPESSTPRGWCHVDENASIINRLRKIRGKSWGYCGKDCFLDKSEDEGDVLREVNNVDILDDALCDEYLTSVLERNTQVKPEILCIGRKKPLSLHAFKYSNGEFSRVKGITHPMERQTGKDYFVHSSGTCQGDSGGPVYTHYLGKYVVLGVVSGGRGVLAKCGGINNPTHYGRVKSFVPWIKKVLGPESEELCILNMDD